MKVITLDKIIGLPPGDNEGPTVSDTGKDMDRVLETVPIIKIYPCVQKYEAGLQLYSLQNAWGDYKDSLGQYDFAVQGDNCINVAYQNTSPFSENYTNEFTESTLFQKFADTAHQGVREVSQMMGTRSGSEMVDKLKANKNAYVKELGTTLAGLSTAGSAMIKEILGEDVGGQVTSTIDSLAAGSKIDFPLLWSNSTFDINYDVSIRLWCFNPSNDELYQKYIIGPMVALMLFVAPRSIDGNTYLWPFLCKISVPGQMCLSSAYLKNMSVIKGGDANDLSWNRGVKGIRCGTVDIRLSFGCMYSSLLNTIANKSDAPTIGKMVDCMKGKDGHDVVATTPQTSNSIDPVSTSRTDVDSETSTAAAELLAAITDVETAANENSA